MKSVVFFVASFAAVLINFSFISADNGRFGTGIDNKRSSYYKHRRGPRLGRYFMDLICDYQVSKEVKLNRLQCVMNKGPIEFKNILETCMYNSTSTKESKAALDRLCNEPETVKQLNSCFFMSEHPAMRPSRPPLRPPVIPVDETPTEVGNNDLPSDLSPPDIETERLKLPEANPEENVIVKRSASFYRRNGGYMPPPCNVARSFGCGSVSPFGGDPSMMGPTFPTGPYGYGAFGPLPPMGPGFNGPPFIGGPPRGPPFFNPNFGRPNFVPGPPPMAPPTGYDPFTRLVESCRAEYPV